MSRTTTAYVSEYQPARVQVIRLNRGSKRNITAVCVGALAPGETLASATWRVDCPDVVAISSASITATQTGVLAAFQLPRSASIKVQITTSAGNKIVQQFDAEVVDYPTFGGDESPTSSGPYSLTVNI